MPEKTSYRAAPNPADQRENGAGVTGPSPPKNDNAPSMVTIHKRFQTTEASTEELTKSTNEQTEEKESRKISVITPAGVWLLGGIRDRVVLSEEEAKKVTDQNQQVDIALMETDGLTGEAADKEEVKKTNKKTEERQIETGQETEVKKELQNSQHPDKALHSQSCQYKDTEEQKNDGELVEGDTDKGENGSNLAAAGVRVTDTKGSVSEEMEKNTKDAGTKSREGRPSNEVANVTRLQLGRTLDGEKDQQRKEEEITSESSQDRENKNLSENNNQKGTEKPENDFSAIIDKNNISGNNNGNNEDGNSSSSNVNDDSSSSSESEDDNDHDSSEDEHDVYKINEDDENTGSDDAGNNGHSSKNTPEGGNGKQNAKSGVPGRRRLKRRLSKLILKWEAKSKVDTGGHKRRSSRKKIKAYKKDFSHVKSRLHTKNGAKRQAQNRPTEVNKGDSLPTSDYSNIKSRLNQGNEVWKREPDIPLKAQAKGKSSYAQDSSASYSQRLKERVSRPAADYSNVQSRLKQSTGAWKREPDIPVKAQVRGKPSYASIPLNR